MWLLETSRSLPGHVFRLCFHNALLLERERPLQDHFHRGAGGIVDLVAAGEQNLGQSDRSADSTSDQRSFATPRERSTMAPSAAGPAIVPASLPLVPSACTLPSLLMTCPTSAP